MQAIADALINQTLAAPATVAQGVLAADGGGDLLGGLLMPAAIVFGIFYFLVIRPQSRERRKREAQVKAIKKHSKIITNAGIYGTVVGMDDETVTLRVDEKNNVRMKFSRAAVWQVLDGDKNEPAPRAGG